ncbi:WD40/YVTN/BNR-like repeat-containing protein [Zestomonas carbonaria]|uniref:Ycf48-like protein n=1 Tax=Zestomonas carbonaria TaxID=2762745 RepID=A0A7U7I8Q7_9GAMM|nr:YCF48-related protein [Pseudomonas carbonaria]CAD5106167.1 Ycf48-like protein [Pseudomonas carbonaria]
MSKLMQFDQSTAHPVARAALGQRALRTLMTVLPWSIIAGLLWAGLFIKPQPVGSTVTPPLLERRDHFYGLALAPSGEVWASGSNGKILAIGADGDIRRLATPTRLTLQDIAVWDASHAVAVGNDGIVLASRDGGRHWHAASGVPRSEVANKLNRVRVAAGGVAIATGEMGALLLSRDYGQTWRRLRDEEDVAWNDVAILDGGRLVVVGEFGRVLHSDDFGLNWQELEAPVPGSLMSVSFRDADHGVAVGLEGTLLVTRDGGLQWESIDLGIHDHLFDVLWNPAQGRWFASGALGRWASAGRAAGDWQSGTLDERNLSWHTRALAVGDDLWLAGADLGRWNGRQWSPLQP